MIETLRKPIDPKLAESSQANQAFAWAVRQEVFEQLNKPLLEMWGKLTFEAKEKALFPWRHGKVPGPDLPETLKKFQKDIKQRFESGETRY